MSAALSIDFGNSYTKVGIRRNTSDLSQLLRSEQDLKFDEDHLCIPTVAAHVVRNGSGRWLYGTEVRPGSQSGATQVFRNWKPRFFSGEETHLEDGRIRRHGENDSASVWDQFTVAQLGSLLESSTLVPEKVEEVRAVLKTRKAAPVQADQDFDFREIGKGYFGWLRKFVEPFCEECGIGTTGHIPVRITLPSFGANSVQARLTLEAILRETGWMLAGNRPALPEPVANLIGTFSGGRNRITQAAPNYPETYNLLGMMGDSALYREIRRFARAKTGSLPPIYWVMIADLGGYTTDFAMVGFDLDNAEFPREGYHDGKRLLGDFSEPIGVHDLDKQVRDVLSDSHRKAFDGLAADVDGRRLDNFHQVVYQRLRPYNTGRGIIGEDDREREKIEAVVRRFADQVAGFAEQFLLYEQYDRIDELILTGGGCNIPLVREAIRRKLEPYDLKRSHIPTFEETDPEGRYVGLERILVRGATALGASSVFFDYD